jgi:RNA-directed DNA polymerase
MLAALQRGVKGDKWFSLIDKVYSMPALEEAFEAVRANKGAAGIDKQTIEGFAKRRDENLRQIAERLQEGTYRPQAVKRVWIDKPGTREKRPLGIPTVTDRIVQGALKNAMEPIFEHCFARHSYGFRPARGCRDALGRVQELIDEGYLWVVDADLKGFFDTLDHDLVMERVREKISDSRLLNLVEAFLKNGIMEGPEHWEPEEGTPQGGVVSPLLSNIYLNPLDHLMEKTGHEMVRYADDFVILCRTRQEAMEALEEVSGWVEANRLTLHPEKTRVVELSPKVGFDFLGYHFRSHNKWPRKKSVMKLKESVRRKTKRTSGRCMRAISTDLNRTLRGWFEYFKDGNKTTMRELDGWIRGRLRAILRKRSKRKGRARGKDHNRWPNALFEKLGLLSLLRAWEIRRQSA